MKGKVLRLTLYLTEARPKDPPGHDLIPNSMRYRVGLLPLAYLEWLDLVVFNLPPGLPGGSPVGARGSFKKCPPHTTFTAGTFKERLCWNW
jgi:hypothetical protein